MQERRLIIAECVCCEKRIAQYVDFPHEAELFFKEIGWKQIPPIEDNEWVCPQCSLLLFFDKKYCHSNGSC